MNDNQTRLVVLSGAGISAESGISTFRDANGLWENHRIEDVASPEGFAKDPATVLRFYNDRRRQLKTVQPNRAHHLLAELQKQLDIQIVTQNVDDLHERAGSTHVLHLHGELLKARSSLEPSLIVDWQDDIHVNDKAPDGSPLRPHIVWFGEEVPNITEATSLVSRADILLVIGTSMLVYPAAGLAAYAPDHCRTFVINPDEDLYVARATIIREKASAGMETFVKKLQEEGIINNIV